MTKKFDQRVVGQKSDKKIRLARSGSKKRRFYQIVVAHTRMPGHNLFIDKLGTYNPLLPKDSDNRVELKPVRIKYWLAEGAQPTHRVARFLEAAGIVEKRARSEVQKRVLSHSKQRIDPNSNIEAPDNFDMKIYLDLDSDQDVEKLATAAQAFIEYLGYAIKPNLEEMDSLKDA